MARLAYLDQETMDPAAAAALEGRRLPNLFRLLAHAPSAMAGFLAFGDGLRDDAELDLGLRELAILRVGALCAADYELHHHKRIALDRGLSPGQIAAATREGPASALSPLEQLVMQFTDAVVLEVKAPAWLYEAVAAELSPRQLMELLLSIGYYGMVCRVLENTEIDIEAQGFA